MSPHQSLLPLGIVPRWATYIDCCLLFSPFDQPDELTRLTCDVHQVIVKSLHSLHTRLTCGVHQLHPRSRPPAPRLHLRRYRHLSASQPHPLATMTRHPCTSSARTKLTWNPATTITEALYLSTVRKVGPTPRFPVTGR